MTASMTARERANRGWDEHELRFRDRFWNESRWAIEETWPRGMRVSVRSPTLAPTMGEIRSNRVDATDCGAYVRLDTGEITLVPWRYLESIEH